jgi:hypothetical protein
MLLTEAAIDRGIGTGEAACAVTSLDALAAVRKTQPMKFTS